MADKISKAVFFIFLGLIKTLFLYIMSPFFFFDLLGCSHCGLFRPLYKRLNHRRERPKLTLIVVLIILISARAL